MSRKQVISLLLAAALLIPSGWLAPVMEAASPEIPVMLYHRIDSAPTNEWTDINHADNTWNSITQPAAATENGMKHALKVGYPHQGDLAMGRYYAQTGTTLNETANRIGESAPAAETQTVYHETFAGGKGVAVQSGGAALTPVTDKIFDGNADGAALYVSNRTDNWDAADFKFSDIGLENGKTYTVTASVYVDVDVSVPTSAQAYLQTISSYALLANANYEAGKAVTLTKEFTVDTSIDTTLRVQSNPEGAAVPFYIGDVMITEKVAGGGEEENPRPPALAFTPITFEDQTAGGVVGRAGTETLTVTAEANHTADGSNALKVEGRNDTWHGPTLRVEPYVDKGFEYKVSAWVKLIEPASSQLQLSTQVGQGNDANYVSLSAKTISISDGWVLLEGTYRYNNVSSEFLTIYVESSSNSTASFYIDDISFERTSSAPVGIQKDLIPLKTKYQNDFLIGNALSAEDLEGVRLELLNMHYNVATAGNAMKPDALQSQKGQFTFAVADALVDKVLAEGLQMHGHVLVWHQQSPVWMNTTTDSQNNTIPLNRDEALTNLRTHIQTVMEHFGDKVISWDVVNEAMNDNPPNPTDWKASLRQSPWYAAIGPDYLEQAFLAAREVLDAHPDWDIKLYYNDYNEDNQNKAQAIYNMVKEINDRYALTHPDKLLIDGVGMQAHYNVNTNPNNVQLSLEKFISLGVEISITELDIQAGSDYQLSENLANAQGYLYAELFDIFKAHAANIKRVTFWGLDDNTSWRASANPLLFDKNLQAKPAYYGVIDPDKFREEHEPESANANQSTAKFAAPVVDGVVDVVWSQTPEIAINRYQMAWQGATGVAKALWDDQNLYILIQVSDAQLDKSSANVWEQDSIEIFLDENNAKTSFYQDDDGQFRVNFANETSFNPPSLAAGFVSATKVAGTNYTVEVKIPFKQVTPADGMKLGFDVQINDAQDGIRQSVAAWNDTTGNGYMDTSVYGELTLTGKTTGSSNNSGGSIPQTGTVENKDGVVTIKPQVRNDNGHTKSTISSDTLKKALEQAAPAADDKKQVIIEVPKQTNTESYEVQLPTQSLKGQESFILLLKTEYGTLQIPSNLLSGVTESAEQVSIRITKASADSVDVATRERIGNHPVIDLSLLASDKVIAWNNPAAPVSVSIPYTPTGEELTHPNAIVVWYIDSSGKAIPIPNGRYDEATGSVVFQTTHFSTYAVANGFKTFGDLQKVPWAKQAIEAMAARNVIQGTAENHFSPAASITRAEFTVLLVETLELRGTSKNKEMFSDVPRTASYYDELVIAKELGIVSGFPDHTFKPNSMISRQDMMVMTAKVLAGAGKQGKAGGTLADYPDAASISNYAKDSAAALAKTGIVAGKNGRIAPRDELTRAEVAVILYHIWNL
ncbi:MAG: endo-1,4-beta-xylanase [Gorillibacterium sp.]|nr:endo-1,4-beta-xylanase [Gorillibacterium sp.]